MAGPGSVVSDVGLGGSWIMGFVVIVSLDGKGRRDGLLEVRRTNCESGPGFGEDLKSRGTGLQMASSGVSIGESVIRSQEAIVSFEKGPDTMVFQGACFI